MENPEVPAWQLARASGEAPSAGSGRILAGTASWTDPTMLAPGVFYPAEAKTPEARLRFYGSLYPIVEVDATYYAITAEPVARAWANRTPPGFTFDVKAHALMTGHPTEVRRLPAAVRELLPPEAAAKPRVYPRDLPEEALALVFELFSGSIEPLRDAGKLGAVLLQFPPWFYPSFGSFDAILEARARLAGLPVSVEFRHGSWFNEKNRDRTLAFLHEHAIPYVVVDEPQGFRSSVPTVLEVTSPDLAIVRFHGRNAATWEAKGLSASQRFNYLYGEEELAERVTDVRQLAREAKEVHLIFNNCYANYGTTNARQIAELLLR